MLNRWTRAWTMASLSLPAALLLTACDDGTNANERSNCNAQGDNNRIYCNDGLIPSESPVPVETEGTRTRSSDSEPDPDEDTPTPTEPTRRVAAPQRNPQNAGEERNERTRLTVRVNVEDDSQVGVNTWKALHNQGTSVDVFDRFGEAEKGCFASLKVLKEGEVVHASQGTCRTRFGISTRRFGSGSITIAFAVETEWGAKESAQRTINIVED